MWTADQEESMAAKLRAADQVLCDIRDTYPEVLDDTPVLDNVVRILDLLTFVITVLEDNWASNAAQEPE